MLAALGSLAGSVVSGLFGNKQAKDNIKYQKQFAQHGIQWKTEDAKRAGIHPLAALGAQTHSFSPVQGGDWSGLAKAGQDIGRAMEAPKSDEQRVKGYDMEVRRLALDRSRLENDVLRADLASKLAKVKQPGTPPGLDPQQGRMIEGQGNSPGVKNEPMERQGWDPNNASREAGDITDTGYTYTGTGWAPSMSKDFKDRSEEDPWAVVGHWARNRIPQSFQYTRSFKPPFPAPTGMFWVFHPYAQEYRLREYTKGPGRYATPMLTGGNR